MMNENTVALFKQALDNAIYTYGNCLCDDIDATGMRDKLEKWIELSVTLSIDLDDVLYILSKNNKNRNKEEQ